MTLYVVLRHPLQEKPPWKNKWVKGNQLIWTIQTTNEIGAMCREAKERGERVYVHRCGWKGSRPVVCCSAEVAAIAAVNTTTTLVQFASPIGLNQKPPRRPVKHQNYYLV
jgi:hypothetical protein